MIFGIGTDIVSIQRMEEAIARHGERFARRVLSDSEWTAYSGSNKPAAFLAKRFAAKEAAAKALGLGFTQGITLQQISVEHDERGKPLLVFHAQAKVMADQLGVGEAFISLSDEHDHAIAFVTLTKRQ